MSILTKILKPLRAGPRATPEMKRLKLERMPDAVYAVGDVHGCLTLLQELETKIFADAAEIPGNKLIVYLGDLIDRGDQSAGVIDHVMSPTPSGFQRLCISGNHEQMMISFFKDAERNSDWLKQGGTETLLSYGILVPQRLRNRDMEQRLSAHIPREHLDFLCDLPVSLELPEYLLVHAGIDPDEEIEDQSDLDMLWIRKRFLSSTKRLRKTVVYGHTPVKAVEVSGQKIGVDTGAFATGRLSAVRLQPHGMPMVFQAGTAMFDVAELDDGASPMTSSPDE